MIHSFTKSLQVEKYEMVALLAKKNDEKKTRKTTQDGSISGDGATVDMCGMNCHEMVWQRKQDGSKKKEKKIKHTTPRDLEPEDTTVHTRSQRPTVQFCGDSNVACKWSSGEISLGPKYREKIGQVKRTLHSWWKK